jgi:hypothetical protein
MVKHKQPYGVQKVVISEISKFFALGAVLTTTKCILCLMNLLQVEGLPEEISTQIVYT